ncbi:MAG TPA: hypothetical protein VJ205_04610, partial [Gammaproteobacteria bacterium]|nr:hypothetical protein [Gammaproteobacteria bacterium]
NPIYPKVVIQTKAKGDQVQLICKVYLGEFAEPKVLQADCSFDDQKKSLYLTMDLPGFSEKAILPLKLYVDGVCEIESLSLSGSLSIDAPYVMFKGHNVCKQLYCNAERFEICEGADVRVNQDLAVEAKIVKLSGNCHVKKFQSSSSNSFENSGIVEAEKIQFYAKKQLTNKGALLSRGDIEIFGDSDVINTTKGHWITSEAIRITGKALHNKGICLSKGAQIIHLDQDFENAGKMVTGESSELTAQKGINRGSIQANKAIKHDYGLSFENEGKLAGLKEVNVKARSVFESSNGEVLAPTVKLISDASMKIGGSVIGDDIHIESGRFISCLHGSVVKGNKVDLVAPSTFTPGAIMTTGQDSDWIDQILRIFRSSVSLAEITTVLPKYLSTPFLAGTYSIGALYNFYKLYTAYENHVDIKVNDVLGLLDEHLLPLLGVGFDACRQVSLISHLIYGLSIETHTDPGKYLKGVHFLQHVIALLKSSTYVDPNAIQLLENTLLGVQSIVAAKRFLAVGKAGWSFLMRPDDKEAARLDLQAEAEVLVRELCQLAKTTIGVSDPKSLPIDLIQFIVEGGFNQKTMGDTALTGCHIFGGALRRFGYPKADHSLHVATQILRQTPMVWGIVKKCQEGTLTQEEAGAILKQFLMTQGRTLYPYIRGLISENQNHDGALLDFVYHLLQKDYAQTGHLHIGAESFTNTGTLSAHDKLTISASRRMDNEAGAQSLAWSDNSIVAGQLQNYGTIVSQTGTAAGICDQTFDNFGSLSGKTAWGYGQTLATNQGILSGSDVCLQGREKGAINQNLLVGNTIKIISQEVATNAGHIAGGQVTYTGSKIHQQGQLSAGEVTVNLLSTEEKGAQSSLEWKGQVKVGHLELDARAGILDYEREALKSDGLTTLRLGENSESSFVSQGVCTKGAFELELPEKEADLVIP